MANDDLSPVYVLSVAGTELGKDLTEFVTSVEYESIDGMADEAKLRVQDPYQQLSDLKVFQPGNELDIWMGYGAQLSYIGRVILRRARYNYPAEEPPSFELTGYTYDAKLMDNSPDEGAARRFPDMKYSDIVENIAQRYQFEYFDIDETPDAPAADGTGKWQKAGVSDYQMIQACANVTGFFLWVEYDLDLGWQINFKDPANVLDTVNQPNLQFEYGNGDLSTLLEFNPEILVQGATTKLRVVFKDPGTGALINEEIEEETASEDISFTGDEEAKAEVSAGAPTEIKIFLQDYSFELPPKRFKNNAEAIAWAQQWFRRNRESLITGNGSTIGVETLRARQIHTLAGLSKRLDGSWYFSRVRHIMDAQNGYQCSFSARKQASLI
jgi:phage protein D